MESDGYTCEVWVEDSWKVVPVEIAREYSNLTRRCRECHGHIKIMRAGPGNRPRAHPEHHKRHKGCSLGDCFDGIPRPHPKQVSTPSDPGPFIPHIPEEVLTPTLFDEGATTSITVNAYERNPKARRACLNHYGYACVVCKFNFELRYGAKGKGIIHVHHIAPLAKIGKAYKVDPVKDLRPVCPNCHAFVHSKAIPYSLGEVATLLKNRVET